MDEDSFYDVTNHYEVVDNYVKARKVLSTNSFSPNSVAQGNNQNTKRKFLKKGKDNKITCLIVVTCISISLLLLSLAAAVYVAYSLTMLQLQYESMTQTLEQVQSNVTMTTMRIENINITVRETIEKAVIAMAS